MIANQEIVPWPKQSPHVAAAFIHRTMIGISTVLPSYTRDDGGCFLLSQISIALYCKRWIMFMGYFRDNGEGFFGTYP